MNENFTTSSEPFSVRRFEAQDREAVLALWPSDIMHPQPGLETIDVLISSVAGAIAGMALVYVAPPLFAIFARGAAQAAGAVAWAMMAIALAPMLRLYRRPLISGFALPAIAAAYVAFTFDSALQYWRGRGGYWKGRFQAPIRETGRA